MWHMFGNYILKIMDTSSRGHCVHNSHSSVSHKMWTLFGYTVYSRYIAIVYIAELDISRSHVGPHFLAHLFREFCRRDTQERDIFCEIAATPCIQFTGDNFSRNLLTAKAFVPIRRSQFFNSSLPVNAGWNTCCAFGSHARRSIDTSIVLQSRV